MENLQMICLFECNRKSTIFSPFFLLRTILQSKLIAFCLLGSVLKVVYLFLLFTMDTVCSSVHLNQFQSFLFMFSRLRVNLSLMILGPRK